MPDRSQRSARVVIMDDVSWSDPAPRGNRHRVDLAPPEWMTDSAPTGRTPVEMDVEPGSFDRRLGEVIERWEAEFAGPEVRALAPDSTRRGRVEPAESQWDPQSGLDADATDRPRTVVITGHGASRPVTRRSSESSGTGVRRSSFAADRTAMWAVLLCVILVLVALTSH